MISVRRQTASLNPDAESGPAIIGKVWSSALFPTLGLLSAIMYTAIIKASNSLVFLVIAVPYQ